MKNHKAIPSGYMTVGELAKKMNTTVRTLQYYDKEGLLSPSAESEGGRRLYSQKDMVQLHQILSMKYLGFSLDDIKNRLIALDTPAEVAEALTQQADAIREKIEALNQVLVAIEALKAETQRMQAVDFGKYADIVALLQQKSSGYWVVKHLDEKMLSHAKTHFTHESGQAIFQTWQQLCQEIAKLQMQGKAPGSEQGQAVAKQWWDMVLQFTGGDMSLLPELMKFAENKENWDEQWEQKQALAEDFIKQAMEIYFTRLGHNPFVQEPVQ